MLNYDTLITQLDGYLDKKYNGISTHTDIFEHAFLHFLGYQFTPEKCRFKKNSLYNNYLSIYLSTPYNLDIRSFFNNLKICATKKFSNINIELIDSNSNQEIFCVHLSIPYRLIETHLSEIFQSINTILKDPFKLEFYRYWNIRAKNFLDDLTIIHIEYLIREKLIQYPHSTFDDVWSAIIQKNIEKNSKIRFLEKQVLNENFPKITMIYEESRKINKIAMTRDQIVKTLEGSILDIFLNGNSTSQEFITPAEINQFIKKKYNRSFSINKAGHFEIDLGYHREERIILEKYGIKEISSYRPATAAEQSCYYIYDKNNYLQLLLALKEIKGEACLEERWHQLSYYIHNQIWKKLAKELKFLLNLKAKTGVKINYIELLIRLNQHIKNNLQGEALENTIEIIEKICHYLVNEPQLKNDIHKEMYKILLELTLIRMNQLEDNNKSERLNLKKELFLYTQKAELEESNLYLAEIAGLQFGNTFSNDVNKAPVNLLLELAEKHKMIIEENTDLKNEIIKLKAENSLQKNIDHSKINAAPYFGLQK